MKIVKCRLAPKRFCVNLFGVIWTRDDSWIDSRVVRHERIHSAQMKEMLWIPFYLFYVLEYLVKLAVYRNSDRAYRAISFEREAYANDGKPDYMSRRRHFAWIRYLGPSKI